VERLNRVLEIGGREVRPAAVGKIELGVGALPQQEVAQTLLAAGADQEIDIPALTRPVVHVAHGASEIFASDLSDIPQSIQCPHHRVAGGIVDRDPEIEPRSVTGCILGDPDGAQELRGDSIAAANYVHPHIIRDAAIRLGDEIAAK